MQIILPVSKITKFQAIKDLDIVTAKFNSSSAVNKLTKKEYIFDLPFDELGESFHGEINLLTEIIQTFSLKEMTYVKGLDVVELHGQENMVEFLEKRVSIFDGKLALRNAERNLKEGVM